MGFPFTVRIKTEDSMVPRLARWHWSTGLSIAPGITFSQCMVTLTGNCWCAISQCQIRLESRYWRKNTAGHRGNPSCGCSAAAKTDFPSLSYMAILQPGVTAMQKPVWNTCMDKMVNYVLNRRETAETYLEDDRCSFTNNLSENTIRPFAVSLETGCSVIL